MHRRMVQACEKLSECKFPEEFRRLSRERVAVRFVLERNTDPPLCAGTLIIESKGTHDAAHFAVHVDSLLGERLDQFV